MYYNNMTELRGEIKRFAQHDRNSPLFILIKKKCG